MRKSTLTVRVETKKKNALDLLARRMDRDRSYLLNEAIDSYLELHEWQVEHIKKGLKQAEKGEFAKQKDVSRAFARWRRGR